MNCTQCKKGFNPAESNAMPFCSKRCKEIDLGRWLNEDYSVSGIPDLDPDEVPEDDWANG